MHLKRLELFGFKTFAERVELEFAPGITAIVGPNGSGKSNLVEAILWVFGEQSLKAVRSTRSHDVIFAGSRDKKAVGLAEVSLTLDNASGKLGLDFSEVTVTRRVYRSGEGEYLLNRIPCRMRDIHDLFMDTGIGRQAYSIVNQSQIDAILSVRPEDRRELIEEAAGVGKYRQRKKEAMRKLDATRANLIRVNDIIGELEGQLEPLSRQSEDARQYADIARELSKLKLSLLVSDHDSFTSSLQRAKERETELVEAIESTRSKEAQLGVEEVTQRARLIEIEEKLEELRTLTGRITQEIDREEGRTALTKEKIRASEQQKTSLEEDFRQLEQSLVEAKAQQEQARINQQEIADKEQAEARALKEKEARLAQINEELFEGDKALAGQRAEQLDLLGRISDEKNSFAQGASLLRTAETRLARLGEERASAQADLQARADSETEKRQELEQLAAALPELRAKLAELDLLIGQAEGRLREWEEAEDALAKQVLATRSRLEALEALVREREGIHPAIQALLEQGFSSVSDILGVSAKFALAIEAALGPWLEGLICESREEALRGRGILREKGGQAGFLILEDISEMQSASFLSVLAGQDGFVGSAAELVESPEKYSRLFKHLLGDVLVVEDIEAALRMREQLPAGGWRIVTLGGETVTSVGMYLGKEKEPVGPLSRKAEIETLKAQLELFDRQLEDTHEKTEAERATLSNYAAEVAQLREQVNANEARRSSLEEALRLVGAELERSRQRLEGMEAECRGLREEIESSAKEQSTLESQIAALEAQHQEMKAGMTAAEESLRTLRARREAQAQEIAQINIQLASLAGERQAQEARLQSLMQSEKAFEIRIGSRQETLRSVEVEKEELVGSLESLAKRWEELKQARQRSTADLEAAAGERQGALEAIAKQLEDAKTNREERDNLQASLHRLQLRITQLEGELSFLQRNLEEDHRISLEKARELAEPVENRKEAQDKAASLQANIDGLGAVNLGAMEEYERVKSRLDFLSTQRQDLEKAREDLEKVIAEIDATAREKFLECFEAVKVVFDELFKRLFNGGETELKLTGDGEILESGLEVEVTVPGKRRQNLLLLSGGERALTAMALIFSLIKVKPTPFVVLDEIDAPLDDSNVGRFAELLKYFSEDSQFIVVTHNKGSMEAADTLYGVTMQKPGISTLISMKLTELPAN